MEWIYHNRFNEKNVARNFRFLAKITDNEFLGTCQVIVKERFSEIYDIFLIKIFVGEL